MNAAAKVTTTGVDVKLGNSTGSAVSANDYVLVGEKVFVEATANGTNGDVILANTYTADGEDKKTSSGDGTTKASIIYTMTNADVNLLLALTIRNPNPKQHPPGLYPGGCSISPRNNGIWCRCSSYRSGSGCPG